MKLESMSKNIVKIMFELTKNEGLARLLVNNVENPFDDSLPTIDRNKLIAPNSELSKIFPYPFDPEAQVNDECFIRVYYNDGDFGSNEVITESQLHVDIIVARSLWLINDGGESLIRPYEIAGRIVDMLGSRSLNSTIRLKFEGYQHLYINPKYDAIRLYSSYMSVEA
jgi:hypothetical protein